MIEYIAFMLTLVVVLLVGLILVNVEFIVRVKENTKELRSVKTKLSTRISRASMRSGPVTEEVQTRGLTRASARRVVVGGDDDSQLKQDMMRAAAREPQNG